MFIVKASDKPKDLTGKGLEFLTDNTGKWIRAAFYDGNFIRSIPKPSKADAERDTVITGN